MPYTPTTWVDDDGSGTTGTAVSATIMNNIETGVDTAIDAVDALPTTYQGKDVDLTAIAGLVSAADKVPYATGAGTWALADFTAAGRALVDDADATAQRTTLGLAIGTNVQAFDTDLNAIAALVSAADRLPYSTGAGTWSLATFTATARTLLDDTSVANMRTTLGVPGLTTINTFSTIQKIDSVLRMRATGGTQITFNDATESVEYGRLGAGTTAMTLLSMNPGVDIFLGSVSVADVDVTIQAIDAAGTGPGNIDLIGFLRSSQNKAIKLGQTFAKASQQEFLNLYNATDYAGNESNYDFGLYRPAATRDLRLYSAPAAGDVLQIANATRVVTFPVAPAFGNPSGTLSNLDTDIAAIAALVSAADQLPYATGAGTWALTTLTSFMRTVLDDTNALTARGTLGTSPSYGNVFQSPQPPSQGTIAWTANTGYVVALPIRGDATITNITFFVVGTPTAGTTARVALYDSGGTRIANRTTNSAALGVNTNTIAFDSAVAVTPGIYYVEVVFSAASPGGVGFIGGVSLFPSQNIASGSMPGGGATSTTVSPAKAFVNSPIVATG